MTTFFWVVTALLVWHFGAYGLFLLLLQALAYDRHLTRDGYTPAVSILIPAHNEEDVIARRIENCLALDYPEHALEVVIGVDGSTDSTAAQARSVLDDRVVVLEFESNRGRSQVHNDCVRVARGEILCFTDADTLYEPLCLQRLVRHYADEKVGCVGGELRSESFTQSPIGRAQGIYWKWEYLIRGWQSKLGVLTKVSGANMSMRKALYKDLPPWYDVDQAAGPSSLLQGYRVVHEPEAMAVEEFPTTRRAEFNSRRRLTLRALTALWHYRELLNPLKHPWAALHEWSYRASRYASPFLLLALLVISLCVARTGIPYALILGLQMGFYLSALLGGLLAWRGRSLPVLSWAYGFVLFQTGIGSGAGEYLLGRRIQAYRSD